MGEYYNWVNVDKKEYLSPGDFDLDNKRNGSLVKGNKLLCALFEILSKEWAGDHVFWMGDEKLISKDIKNDTLRIIYEDSVKLGYDGSPFDTICEVYKNISSLFKAAEANVREEIDFYFQDIERGIYIDRNEYGIDVNDPFKDFFLREGKDFCYVINHTKKLYFSLEGTKILHKDNTESHCFNPLSILMSYGRTADDGEWLGDLIGVSDEIPKGYRFLSEVYLDW